MNNESSAADVGSRANGVSGADTAASLQEAARKFGAQAADLGDQVYRQALDAGRYAGRQVTEQPWAAAVASGLLGLMVGYLLARGTEEQPRSMRDYADDYLPRQLRKR
jgi:ElaB/YqjD/DUF883 family membrane-anchored ribosome-binding protein